MSKFMTKSIVYTSATYVESIDETRKLGSEDNFLFGDLDIYIRRRECRHNELFIQKYHHHLCRN